MCKSKYCKEKTFLFLLPLFFLFGHKSYAVGITDVDVNNDEIALYFRSSTTTYSDFMSYGCPEDNRMVAFLKAGETLNFGFKFKSGGSSPFNTLTENVWVRIKKMENDDLVFGPVEIKQGNAGYINSINEAAGPNTIQVGGYIPQTYTALVDGEYYIEVGYNEGPTGDVDNFNPAIQRNLIAPLYDFTVTNNNTEIPGRVWSKAWNFYVIAGWNGSMYSKQYIYTDDGIISELDYNGMNPFVFTLSSNSTGASNTGNIINDRKSITSRSPDIIPQYRLFFDIPDTTVYKLADIDQLFGKLNKDISVSGCPGNYCLNVDVNKNTNAKLVFDLNGVAGFQENSADLTMDVDLVSGDNCVNWDGLDGTGQVVNQADLVIDIEFVAGVTHLPKYDVEYNINGINVEFLYPTEIAGPAKIFWDDSNIGGTTNTDSGCESNCHAWTSKSYGDIRIINSWWYITKPPIQSSVQISSTQLDAGPNVNACSNESISLNPSNGFSAYFWSPAIAISDPNSKTPSLTGDYEGYITLLASDDNGCVYKDSILSSYFSPKAIISKDTSICQGESIELQVTGADNYTWSENLGTGNSKIVSPSNDFIYTIISNDNNGCSDTAKIKVNVYEQANVSLRDTFMCKGGSLTLTINGNGDYYWGSDLGMGKTKTLSPETTKTFTVEAQSPNGCSNTVDFQVEVFEKINLISSDTIICEGESVLLTVDGAKYYNWNNGLGNGPSKEVSPTENTIYSIIGKDETGCSDTTEIALEVLPAPEIEAFGAEICPGESAIIHAKGANSYIWENTGVGSDLLVQPNETTTYTVIGTNDNGCKGYQDVTVEIKDTPTLDIILSTEEKILKGEAINVQVIGNAEYIDIEDLPDGSILYSGRPSPTYLIPDSSSSYLITGLLENCEVEASFDVEVVELIKVPSMITPNGDFLNDQWIIENIEDFPEAEVTLYNRWGNIVFKTTNYDQTFQGLSEGADLPAAVYYYVINLNYRDYKYKGSLTIMR